MSIYFKHFLWILKCSTHEDLRIAYKILVGKPERRRKLGRTRIRWESNIKLHDLCLFTATEEVSDRLGGTNPDPHRSESARGICMVPDLYVIEESGEYAIEYITRFDKRSVLLLYQI